MKKRVTVITSKFETKSLWPANIVDMFAEDDRFIWIFANEDDAYRATVRFMNADIPYVQRIV